VEGGGGLDAGDGPLVETPRGVALAGTGGGDDDCGTAGGDDDCGTAGGDDEVGSGTASGAADALGETHGAPRAQVAATTGARTGGSAASASGVQLSGLRSGVTTPGPGGAGCGG
jgi:hypothetical protein